MKIIAEAKQKRSLRRGPFAKGAAAAMALAALMAAAPIHAQNAPANLSPDVQEIVKFTQAHMSDDVILTYVKNSGKVYNLSADDLLYLNNQGVSQPVISALLKTASNAPAPAPAPVASAAPLAAPVAPPPPAPAEPPPPPPPPVGLVDNFGTDAALNPGLWAVQTPLLQSLAQWSGSAAVPPGLVFGPAGLQMSGVNGPGQFTGVQSIAAFAPPFRVTATVSGLAPEGIPFDLYLVTADLRQFVSVAGHLGGAGVRGGEIRARVPFVSLRIPEGGHPPSPEYGAWANWSGSGQPIGNLGNQIFPAPVPNVPYTISITVGPDGVASVTYQDPAGVVLGTLNSMPVGMGPFNVVLASRGMGPTFANWNSVNVESLAPPPPPVPTAPPEVPTLDYFTAHLSPYGQWISVPDVGSAWVPMEANNPDWRPYMDAGHWEYTDAGWFWQSDYAWGDIAFHYGRWIKNDFTGDRWAWAPGYDWAPSWVVWREGDGGMGWAPLPWGVEFHPGVGLWWHGAAVTADVSFGIGFDAFVFVGSDHFWGGDYHRYAFDRERAHAFYDHSAFHVGYRMEGGHLIVAGLGRDHIAAITHHEVVVHRAEEMRHAEERKDFARRNEEHHEIARTVAHQEAAHAEAHRAEAARSEGNRPEANRAEARRAEPGRAEPGRAEPGRAEGNRPEAAQRPGANPTANRPGAKPTGKPAPKKEEDRKNDNPH